MDVATFVTKFHNLEGTTLAETKKNANLLFMNIPSDIDNLLISLKPQTYLEHVHKLKLLIKLNRIPELLEVLKSEESLSVKLLKNRMFCKKLATRPEIVSGILPFLSYVIRKRLLTQLAVYGTELDGLYDEVLSQYGIHLASDLLVGCSIQKIEKLLEETNVVLSPLHAKVLYKKHPQLFVMYRKKGCFRNIDISVFRYVAENDIYHLLEILKESDNIGGVFGKRLTRKIVTMFKNFVIENAEKCLLFLGTKTVFKVMKPQELSKFIQNGCLSNRDTLGWNINLDLLHKRLGKNYTTFWSEIIEGKYNKTLEDFPNLITDKILEAMSPDDRQKWIEVRRKNGVSENDLIPFMKVTDAIPLIKNKINVTSSISDRDELIQLLVKTCKVNHDLDCLSEIGQYVCSRHRNDNENTLTNFLYTVLNNFEVEKLEEHHWTTIDEVLNILELRDAADYILPDIYIKKIAFLFNHQKLTDDHLCKLLKVVRKTHRWDQRGGGFQPQLQKLLLLKSIEFMPNLIDEEKIEYADLNLISRIFEYNQAHPKERILIQHPRLLASLEKTMKEAAEIDEYISELQLLSSIFKAIICNEKSEFRDATIRHYFSSNFRIYNLEIDMWLLKNEPHVLAIFFDNFLDHLFQGFSPNLEILNFVKKFTSDEFRKRVVARAVELVSKNENLDVAFPALAILEAPGNFLAHITGYTKDRSGSIAIAKSFKYATSSDVFPALLTYCQGDLLRYALESLYYHAYHNSRFSSFFDQLSEKAVSVRKHSIFLACAVASVPDVRRILQKFLENERNVSVRKHLFTAILKYFTKNPSDEFWDYVKTSCNLDKYDKESFSLLLDVSEIPEKYRAKHVMFVWDILGKGEDTDANRRRLLSRIPEDVFSELPLEFILRVISDNFLKNDDHDDFVVSCLRQNSYKLEVITAIFEIITCAQNMKSVFNFVENMTRHLETDTKNLNTLRIFSVKWHSIYPATQAIKTHLQLNFAVFYLESEKDLLRFSKLVTDFLDQLVSLYGIVILDLFAEETKSTLQNCLCCYQEYNEDVFKFFLEILQRGGLACNLLVLKLLPVQIPEEDAAKKLLLQTVEALKRIPDESVQMLLTLWLTDYLTN